MVYLENVILLLQSIFMNYQTMQGMELPTCGIQLVSYQSFTNELA
jgi:hypothetical protein